MSLCSPDLAPATVISCGATASASRRVPPAAPPAPRKNVNSWSVTPPPFISLSGTSHCSQNEARSPLRGHPPDSPVCCCPPCLTSPGLQPGAPCRPLLQTHQACSPPQHCLQFHHQADSWSSPGPLFQRPSSRRQHLPPEALLLHLK